jgi:hypothetical protein
MSFVPSVLGRSFFDAQFIFAGAGILVQGSTVVGNIPGIIPTLVLQGASGSTPMIMCDSTLITVDDTQDRVDSNPPLLTASYVLSQNPPPGTQFTPGQLVIATYNAVGYPIPTPHGTIPVP